MLYNAFIGSESIITYFFIIATVANTYHEEITAHRKWFTILVALLLFALIFKPIEILYGNYYFYLGFTTLSAFLYCFLFLRKQLLIASAMIAYLMYEVVMTKSALACILGISKDLTVAKPNRIIMLLILYLTFICFSFFFQNHKISSNIKLPFQYWVAFFGAPLLLILCAEWFSQHYAQITDRSALLPYLCLAFALLLTYYLSFLIIKNYEENIQTGFLNQKLELQTDYIKQSSAMIHQVRKERHELKNNYFYIQTLVKGKKYDALDDFLNREMQQHFELMEEFHTGNKLVDYILTQKVNEARDANIHVMTNVLLPETLAVKEQDLCALLLNLIDNAIEASKKEQQGDIHITINIVKQYLSIQIKNKSTLNILKQNPYLKTIKPDAIHHGLGLQIIRQIVEKYNGIFDTSMESGYFCASVMLVIKDIPTATFDSDITSSYKPF